MLYILYTRWPQFWRQWKCSRYHRCLQCFCFCYTASKPSFYLASLLLSVIARSVFWHRGLRKYLLCDMKHFANEDRMFSCLPTLALEPFTFGSFFPFFYFWCCLLLFLCLNAKEFLAGKRSAFLSVTVCLAWCLEGLPRSSGRWHTCDCCGEPGQNRNWKWLLDIHTPSDRKNQKEFTQLNSQELELCKDHEYPYVCCSRRTVDPRIPCDDILCEILLQHSYTVHRVGLADIDLVCHTNPYILHGWGDTVSWTPEFKNMALRVTSWHKND